MSRKNKRGRRYQSQPASQPVQEQSSPAFQLTPESTQRLSMAAYNHATAKGRLDLKRKPDNWFNQGTMSTLGFNRGRPTRGTDSRDTMPTDDRRSELTQKAGWDGLSYRVLRPEIPLFSFENMKWSDVDLQRAARQMHRMSADVAMARHLVKRLANTGIVVSVKQYTEEPESSGDDDDVTNRPLGSAKPAKKSRQATGLAPSEDDKELTGGVEDEAEPTREDPVATRYASEMLNRAGQQVLADVPGATGGLNYFIDQLIDYGITDGAMPAELVLNKSRDQVVNMVAFDPITVEIHRDHDHPGYYLIGQRRWDVDGGWRWLNPNLVCYKALNGTLYGECEYLTALHVLPLWMGYFGKLSIFLHRAAFGFLDGSVKMEVLIEMWKQVPAEVRGLYDDDFMSWAQAMVEFLADSYKQQEETDPDSIQVHLDLLELKAEATGKASFPIDETSKVLKQELYAALKTPGEMMGQDSVKGDRFAAMKVESYHSYLKFIQNTILEIINRFVEVGLTAMGYDKKIKADCRFNPIPIDDRLTQAQAVQLEQLCQRFLRDENIISQNEMSRNLIGKPAIGSAPLSDDADPDGPSAPSKEFLGPSGLPQQDDPGFASGPSFGGKKKGANDRAPNQQKDKKM